MIDSRSVRLLLKLPMRCYRAGHIHVSTSCVKPSIASGVAELKPSCLRIMAIDRWMPRRDCECSDGVFDTKAPTCPSLVCSSSVPSFPGIVEMFSSSSEVPWLVSTRARLGAGSAPLSGDRLRFGETMLGGWSGRSSGTVHLFDQKGSRETKEPP